MSDSMDWDTLLAEAEAIARDCIVLVPCDHPADAVGFEQPDYFRARGPDLRHWITVRSSLLPEYAGDARAWTSVLAGSFREEEGLLLEWTGDLPAASPGLTLLGPRPYRSLPPIEGIFLFGSSAVAAWLAELGWPRDEPFAPEFPDSLGARYDAYYLEQYPHGQPDARAVLGGWHNFWPDGDWYQLNEYVPALCARQEENWIEVYYREGQWLVVPRL